MVGQSGSSGQSGNQGQSRSGRQSSTWSQSGNSNRSGSNDQASSGSNEQWSNWDDEKDVQARGVWRVNNLLGKQVRNSQGEDLGQIEDIVIDFNNQQVRYAALSHGGMLGIGEKLFAVPLNALREQQDDDGNTQFVLNVDDETLDNVEGFEDHKSWPAQADTSFMRGGNRTQQVRTSTQYGNQGQNQNRSQGESWTQNRSQGGQSWSQNQNQNRSQQTAGQSQGTRSFQGEFDEFDEDENQITVTTNDGRRRVYNVDENVRVTRHGRQADLDELEEGDSIRLSYTTGSDNRTIVTAVSDASQQASYNSASYDPNEQNQGSQTSQSGSRSGSSANRSSQDQSNQNRGMQNNRRTSTGESTSTTGRSSGSSSGNRSTNRSGASGQSDSDSSDSANDNSSDDDSSSSRSSSRSSNRNRSSDDSNSSSGSSNSSDRSNESDE
jgi:sporulation protein YlmC with PRC-barrel domain